MSQRDRDRLVVLRKLKAKQIRQAQAATELGVSVRHVRRLLERYPDGGDQAIVHGLRGRTSHRIRDAKRASRRS